MKSSIILIASSLLISSVVSEAKQPLLMSDLSPSQIYSKQQIANQLDVLNSKTSSDLSTLQKEYLLLKKINAVDINNISTEDLNFLQQYSSYKSQNFVKHDEGPLPVAIFDIASRAKHKLNQHYVFSHSNSLKILSKQDWQSFLQVMSNNDDLKSNVIKQSKMKMLSGVNAKQSMDIAKRLLITRSFEDPLVLKAVTSSNDADLTSQLLSVNASPEAHQILNKGLSKFLKSEQENLLKKVIESNPNLSSHAIAIYAKLPTNIQNNNWLTQKLSDSEVGIDVAKAIGVSKNQQALEFATNLVMKKSANRNEVANGLLALRFANNDYAKTQLKYFVDQNIIKYKDMQLEVAKWLD